MPQHPRQCESKLSNCARHLERKRSTKNIKLDSSYIKIVESKWWKAHMCTVYMCVLSFSVKPYSIVYVHNVLRELPDQTAASMVKIEWGKRLHKRSCCEKSKSARCPNLERRETSRRYKANSWKSSSTQYTVEIHREPHSATKIMSNVRWHCLCMCLFRGRLPQIHSNGKYINQLINCAWNYKRTKEMNCCARFSRRRTRFVRFGWTFAFAPHHHNQAKSYQLCVHLEPICKHSFWWKLKRMILYTANVPNQLQLVGNELFTHERHAMPLCTRNNFLTPNKCQIMFIFGLISGIPRKLQSE